MGTSQVCRLITPPILPLTRGGTGGGGVTAKLECSLGNALLSIIPYKSLGGTILAKGLSNTGFLVATGFSSLTLFALFKPGTPGCCN